VCIGPAAVKTDMMPLTNFLPLTGVGCSLCNSINRFIHKPRPCLSVSKIIPTWTKRFTLSTLINLKYHALNVVVTMSRANSLRCDTMALNYCRFPIRTPTRITIYFSVIEWSMNLVSIVRSWSTAWSSTSRSTDWSSTASIRTAICQWIANTGSAWRSSS